MDHARHFPANFLVSNYLTIYAGFTKILIIPSTGQAEVIDPEDPSNTCPLKSHFFPPSRDKVPAGGTGAWWRGGPTLCFRKPLAHQKGNPFTKLCQVGNQESNASITTVINRGGAASIQTIDNAGNPVLWITGGQIDRTFLKSTEYIPAKGDAYSGPDLVRPRCCHCMAKMDADGDKILIFGGLRGENRNDGATEIYHHGSLQMKTGPSMPKPFIIYACGHVVSQDKYKRRGIVAIGSTKDTSRVWVLDVKWSEILSPPNKARGTGITTADGRFLLLAGGDSHSAKTIYELKYLKLRNWEWKELKDLQLKRDPGYFPVAMLIPDSYANCDKDKIQGFVIIIIVIIYIALIILYRDPSMDQDRTAQLAIPR